MDGFDNFFSQPVTPTFGVKYIGSKDKLTPYIVDAIKEIPTPIKSAIDVFTGTTRVAQILKSIGLRIFTSDLNWASEVYSQTFIGNEGSNQHLQPIIDSLNKITPKKDWITTNYCDVVPEGGYNIVRVWQAKNGMKADAIRNKIESFDLKPWEKSTLITSLIFALDATDSTVGVQQAYLKNWSDRSNKDLFLKLPHVIKSPKGKHETGDALKIIYPSYDVAYLDPPYSQHSYATYYHIWDSIVRWDKPKVSLQTNRRIDRVSGSEEYDESMSSLWNKRNDAIGATENLIDRLPVNFVILSYNNEGIIKIKDMLSLLKKYDRKAIIKKIDYKRNIMSSIGNATLYNTEFNIKNQEFIITIEKK